MLMGIAIEGTRKVPQPRLELLFSANICFVFGSLNMRLGIIEESLEVIVAVSAVGLHRISHHSNQQIPKTVII